MTVKLAIAGAQGRMGLAVARVAADRTGMQVVARFDREPAMGLVPREAALEAADVVIDFTSGEASAELARLAAKVGSPALVIGSTGFSGEAEDAVIQASRKVAIVKSGNFSLGVNVLVGLARQAAKILGPEFDIEVFEAHHRRKVDAPSGTALMLGRAAAEGRGEDLDEVMVAVRDGITGPRAEGSIGFSVMRGGGIVGEHSVVFAGEEEILTLSHSARDRALFARGAVEAAAWVAGKGPGLYDMQDVLGLALKS